MIHCRGLQKTLSLTHSLKKLKELDPEAFDLDQINEAVTNLGASYLFVEWFRSRPEEERAKAYSSLSFEEFYSLLEFREEISLLKMLPHCSFTLEERHKIYLKTANADMVFALLSLKDDGVTRWLNQTVESFLDDPEPPPFAKTLSRTIRQYSCEKLFPNFLKPTVLALALHSKGIMSAPEAIFNVCAALSECTLSLEEESLILKYIIPAYVSELSAGGSGIESVVFLTACRDYGTESMRLIAEDALKVNAAKVNLLLHELKEEAEDLFMDPQRFHISYFVVLTPQLLPDLSKRVAKHAISNAKIISKLSRHYFLASEDVNLAAAEEYLKNILALATPTVKEESLAGSIPYLRSEHSLECLRVLYSKDEVEELALKIEVKDFDYSAAALSSVLSTLIDAQEMSDQDKITFFSMSKNFQGSLGELLRMIKAL